MSLKVFHIIFITSTVLLCVYFGFWLIKTNLLLGLCSFSFAIGLIYYGNIFLKKIKKLGY